MIYQADSADASGKGKLLSAHLGTWENKKKTGPGEGWSQVSYDSSEMGNIASPFDDIGYDLAVGGPDANRKSVMNLNAGEKRPETKTTAARPTLGAFLESAEPEEATHVVRQAQHVNGANRRNRLEKSFSQSKNFEMDEESLPFSVAMMKSVGGPHDQSGDTDLFQSGMGSSRGKFSRADTARTETARTDTTRSTLSKSITRYSMSSKQGSKSFSSKLSSMMRSKQDASKAAKAEEMIQSLQSENSDLVKENRLLQAKLEEFALALEKQSGIAGWKNLSELVNATTEMHKAKSQSMFFSRRAEQLEKKLALTDNLIASKEKSICNLEKVRDVQEKRIGYLEVMCLQNGISITEAGSNPYPEEAPLNDSAQEMNQGSQGSFASFQDDVVVSTRSLHLTSDDDTNDNVEKVLDPKERIPVGSSRQSVDSWFEFDTELGPSPELPPLPSSSGHRRRTQSRSKSPGTRRRMKSALQENADSAHSQSSAAKSPSRRVLRSKSPGRRRRLKESVSGQLNRLAGSSHDDLDRSSRGRSSTHGKSRLNKDSSELGSSNHSINLSSSVHRPRRNRVESEMDKSAVSLALDNALGDEDDFGSDDIQIIVDKAASNHGVPSIRKKESPSLSSSRHRKQSSQHRKKSSGTTADDGDKKLAAQGDFGLVVDIAPRTAPLRRVPPSA